ncbi:hypothetical protein GCM10008018_29040 [Paenibacillus marchantiophytorum]|uniref:LysM domain-containing protein n=1 Tax=Paenibacillus marchantiophytorum TaxID=1619310 RepID=A0ABQ1EPN4_9BACL|nr:hypothetical protein [Paenibacillus marchantiophytorum]GFZ81495.1 hypothetical protein GCM10008018_29040 [Paenibacillus marchantiophytorum]
MNTKQMLMASTVAITLSMGGTTWTHSAYANPITNKQHTKPIKEDLLQVLGVSSDDDIYKAQYNGQSLADIAAANQVDVQKVIELQLAELTELLKERLSSGSITPAQYQAQRDELPEIIVRSVYAL